MVAMAAEEEEEEVSLGVIMTNTEILHIFHVISLFNLPFFHIFQIFSLFDLPFFHNFHIFSLFSSIFSISFHYVLPYSILLSTQCGDIASCIKHFVSDRRLSLISKENVHNVR